MSVVINCKILGAVYQPHLVVYAASFLSRSLACSVRQENCSNATPVLRVHRDWVPPRDSGLGSASPCLKAGFHHIRANEERRRLEKMEDRDP